MVTNVEQENSNGKMDHIIVVVTHKAKEMVMDSFSMQKIKQEVEGSGKMVFYKDRVNMFKKVRSTNVYGLMVS